MSHKITFFVLSSSKRPVKQYSISKFFIFFIFLFFISTIALVGYGARDYYRIKMEKIEEEVLKTSLDQHQEIVSVQRRQIQTFAEEINNLKGKLIALNGFERQIRIIANLDHSETNEALFGVGGSIPEDLDPKVDLAEKHNTLIRAMHNQIDQLNEATTAQEESFEALLLSLDEQKNLLACTPAIWPTRGIITSGFGNRKSPFTGMNEFHKGLDIASKHGTKIIAVADGTVTFADRKGTYGKMMVINHGHGMVTRYAHLDEFLKKVGEKVKRGEIIAEMGNTGRSTGPHLHYEVRLNGVPVDPKLYILN